MANDKLNLKEIFCCQLVSPNLQILGDIPAFISEDSVVEWAGKHCVVREKCNSQKNLYLFRRHLSTEIAKERHVAHKYTFRRIHHIFQRHTFLDILVNFPLKNPSDLQTADFASRNNRTTIIFSLVWSKKEGLFWRLRKQLGLGAL